MNLRNLILFVITLSVCNSFAQKIQIINTDALRYDSERQSKYCIGNVKVLHEGVYIQCDSAAINDRLNTIDGVGSVYIYQPDTFDMRGKRVFYDGKTKIARVSGDVVLKDGKMTLTTPFIDYDTETKSGSYSAGGKIINEADVLTSEKGYYNSRTQTASFRNNVKLVNPDYTMSGDTLKYNTATRTAYFFGPTVIESEENRIECVWGYYNTYSNLASFSKRATIFGETSKITADSFFYDRNKGEGEAFFNIVMIDTVEDINVYGQSGIYNERTKESVITDLPMTERISESDTMLLLADTFYYFSEPENKKLVAYRNAKVFSNDMSGVSDTIIYYLKDSMILFLNDPVLWNENNQITGDTISVYMKNKQLDYMFVREHAFVASNLDDERFNQMSGNKIYNYFHDGSLTKVNVLEQGQSIYYSREDDTGAYSGVNKIESGEITINIDSLGINNIRFYPSPDPNGTMYPPLDFPESESKLDGLLWRAELKPQEQEFFIRKEFKDHSEIQESEIVSEEKEG